MTKLVSKTKATRTVKPKCNATPCGFTCISSKYTCSSSILKRDADALVKATSANTASSAELRGGHDYTASLADPGLKTADNTWTEVREQVVAKQQQDLARITGLSTEVITKGIEAIGGYANADYGGIRAADAGIAEYAPGLAVTDKYTKLANDMNNLVSKLPKYDGKIERGLSFKSEERRDEFIKSIADGLQLEAMSSFSSDSDVANTYSGRSNGVVLSVKKNKSGSSIKPFTSVKGESEVIVSRGTAYKTLSISKDSKGLTTVELEEL